MKIAIDLRSLQTGSVTGVENYILNLLEHLLELDRQNNYIFFYNAFGTTGLKHLQYVNSQTVETKIPNRFLNLSLKFINYPKFEKLLGNFDILFLPNANYFAITSGKKLVVTVHDLSPFILPEFYNLRWRLGHFMQNIAKTYKRADLLLAVSEHTKQDLIKVVGIPENKIKVIHPGVDHRIFHSKISIDTLREVRNIYGLPGDYLLFISTLEPRKNLTGLIKAYEQSDTQSDLVIVGKLGWKYDEILQTIAKSPKKKTDSLFGIYRGKR
jgi:glycosyltransferase involved in cell wall biosynthesis